MGYYISNDLVEFRRGKDKQKRKGRSVLGTAVKVAGSGALLAAGTRYGGAAILKRSQKARDLATQGINKAMSVGGNLNKSNNNLVKSIGNNLQKRAVLGEIGLKVNEGARGTLRNDVSKITKALGIKIKKKDKV